MKILILILFIIYVLNFVFDIMFTDIIDSKKIYKIANKTIPIVGLSSSILVIILLFSKFISINVNLSNIQITMITFALIFIMSITTWFNIEFLDFDERFLETDIWEILSKIIFIITIISFVLFIIFAIITVNA